MTDGSRKPMSNRVKLSYHTPEIIQNIMQERLHGGDKNECVY